MNDFIINIIGVQLLKLVFSKNTFISNILYILRSKNA